MPIALEWGAIVVMHDHGDKRLIDRQPWHRHRAAVRGHQDAVGVAAFKHQWAAFDIGAENIDIERRKRHPDRALGKFFRVVAGHAFAAHAAV